jgi:hypothetical protein
MEDFLTISPPHCRWPQETEAPATITYASVVSCETMHLALTIAALNEPKVKVGDVLNAYVTAPIKEKCGLSLDQQTLDMMQAKVL